MCGQTALLKGGGRGSAGKVKRSCRWRCAWAEGKKSIDGGGPCVPRVEKKICQKGIRPSGSARRLTEKGAKQKKKEQSRGPLFSVITSSKGLSPTP